MLAIARFILLLALFLLKGAMALGRWARAHAHRQWIRNMRHAA